MTGAERIARERARQIEEEGWSLDHDDLEHTGGELAQAAIAYALAGLPDSPCYDPETAPPHQDPAFWWPWEKGGFRPSDDEVRNLEKAGALIAAEIDRLTGDGR